MINYPNNIIKQNIKFKNYANRGMTLEADINQSNEYYLEKDIAVIYKKPTPIQIVEKNNEKIVKAYFKTPSTTDYNGLYKGKYIDFDAKETKSKTSFPLNNIHNHQIKHLQNIKKHGGLAFIIVRFTNLNLTYLLSITNITDFIKSNKRKSIPINYFKKNAYLINEKITPRVDYLEIIDKYWRYI